MDDIGNINNFEQEVLKILLDKEQFNTLDDEGKNMIREIIDINLFFDVTDRLNNITDLEYNEIYNDVKGEPISLCILYNTNDDSLKEKIIRDLKEMNLNVYSLIKELNIDDNKIRLINEFLEEIPLHTKIDILRSIESDNLKLDFIKHNSLNLSEGAIIEIFKSLESDELKLNELDGFSFDKKNIFEIIEGLKNDYFKMNFLKKPPFPMDQYEIMNTIRYLESDELKFKEIDFDMSTYDALEIINTFEQPKFVASALNKLIIEKSINNDYNYDNYEIERNNQILTYLLHLERNDNLEIYRNVFDKLLPFISYQYKLNPENLKQIAEMYGYDVLKYISSDSLTRFINGPIENINKIDYVINSLSINMTDINNVYNCLLQKKFTLDHPEVINIFSTFNLAFEENNVPMIHNNIKILSSNNLILGIFKDREFLQQIKKHGYVATFIDVI